MHQQSIFQRPHKVKFVEAALPEIVRPRVQYLRDDNGRLLATKCTLFVGSVPVAHGQAVVNDSEPSPRKKIGRAIAVGRAMRQAYDNGMLGVAHYPGS